MCYKWSERNSEKCVTNGTFGRDETQRAALTVVGNELDSVAMAQPSQHLKRKSPYKSNIWSRHALEETIKFGQRDVRLDPGAQEEALHILTWQQSKRYGELQLTGARKYCFVVWVGAGRGGAPQGEELLVIVDLCHSANSALCRIVMRANAQIRKQ